MNPQQKQNVARYLYDLSKIVFAAAVVGNLIARQHFSVVTLMSGGMVTLVFLWWGFTLDGGRG